MELAIGSLLLGAALGLWFNVIVVIPVVLFATLIVGIEGSAHTLGLSRIVLAVVVSGIPLQIGYLSGAGASVLISKMQQVRAARGLKIAHVQF
jgi:hypothetical protein